MKLIFFLTMMDKEEEYSGKWATTLKSLSTHHPPSNLLTFFAFSACIFLAFFSVCMYAHITYA